ncbi:hypothetical protein DL93DRAFT_2078728 [Clavulina sp. PMI_390]|nr:hypothetical protein DL93DRAFT_2078728 [Clavulina sp. PMI_390]
MAWAFSLFIVGLAMVITIQSLLLWCSRLDNYPFSTPAVWELALGLGVYGACAAVVTAIAILVVTVFSLQFNVSSDPYVNPNAANWDAHLIFDVDPKWAATAAFSVSLAFCQLALRLYSMFGFLVRWGRCYCGYPCFLLLLNLQLAQATAIPTQH